MEKNIFRSKIEALLFLKINKKRKIFFIEYKKEVLPRFELGLMDSKSSVLTVTP